MTIQEGTLIAGPTGADQEGPLDETSHALGSGDVFLVGGTLRNPSLDPLTILVGGNYSQGPGGTLALGVAGINGEDYDHVLYGHKASLDGTLSVSPLPGFTLEKGNVFVVLQNSNPKINSINRFGQFAQINDSLINTNPNLQRIDVYAPNGVALVYVAAITPLPTPTPTPPVPGPTPSPTPKPRSPIDIVVPMEFFRERTIWC